MRRSGPRLVVAVACPRLQPLDLVGPLEVFAAASRIAEARAGGRGERPYDVRVVSGEPGPVATASGYAVFASESRSSVRGRIDTLIVPGGSGAHEAMGDRALVGWIRRTARRSRRVAAVCTGAFLLAEAGLLDGKRATTHWASCDRLARLYPKVTVEQDPIFLKQGAVYTSAGVTAGIDLALALVEEDLGREVALEAARWLVVFLKRPGGQSQFSAQLASQAGESRPLADLCAFVLDHPNADLTVEALARRASMSPRNFARRFGREIGLTPARYVEKVRVETARRRLEATEWGIEEVAARCGFGSAETMRRAFMRTLGVAPSAYRARFTT